MCRGKLTEQVWEDAEEFGLPVAHANFDDDCPDYITWSEFHDNTEQTA
jgi:hypothetical protein